LSFEDLTMAVASKVGKLSVLPKLFSEISNVQDAGNSGRSEDSEADSDDDDPEKGEDLPEETMFNDQVWKLRDQMIFLNNVQ